MTENSTVVIDNGSNTIKAGFGGDEAPSEFVLSRISRAFSTGPETAGIDSNYYVGEKALARCNVLQVKYPISYGYVNNWNDMEDVWHYVFEKALGINAEQHSVFLTEPPLNHMANREKTTQVMFETFNVPRMTMHNTAVLSCFATGRTTGIVLDCGHDMVRALPVYQGYSLPHAITRTDVGGSDITHFLCRTLKDKGYDMHYLRDRTVIQHIINKLCYVSADFAHEQIEERSFELPDGNNIVLGEQLYRCPEIMFQPTIADPGTYQIGIQPVLLNAIKKCDSEMHKVMYDNVILAGGSSMYAGMPDRIKKEISTNTDYDTNIVVNEERHLAAWIGASVLSTLDSFQHFWITSDEYEENGPCLIHRRVI